MIISMTMEPSSTAQHMGGVYTLVQSTWGTLPGGRMFILRAEEQIRDRRYGKNVLGRRNGMSRGPEVSDSMANS